MAPSCLLNQVNDYEDVECHSPLIGWALDGFPIYGPHGLDGEEMYSCNDEFGRQNDKDCLDECNGHGQHTIDGFKYHYHVNGPIGDLTSSPLQPLPTSDRRPYTILCLKGVPYQWGLPPPFSGPTGYGAVAENARDANCSAPGYTDDYVPETIEGLPLYTGEPLDDYADKGSKGCKARKKNIGKPCDDKDKSKDKSKSDSKSEDKNKSKDKDDKDKDKGEYDAAQGLSYKDDWIWSYYFSWMICAAK